MNFVQLSQQEVKLCLFEGVSKLISQIVLSEYLSDTELGFSIDTDFIISVLLWVDDVISCVESEEEQEEMLMKVNEFAIKHKIKWGQSKCNVMRVGKHKKSEREWKLGDMVIQETK